jgi:hypothetical protein
MWIHFRVLRRQSSLFETCLRYACASVKDMGIRGNFCETVYWRQTTRGHPISVCFNSLSSRILTWCQCTLVRWKQQQRNSVYRLKLYMRKALCKTIHTFINSDDFYKNTKESYGFSGSVWWQWLPGNRNLTRYACVVAWKRLLVQICSDNLVPELTAHSCSRHGPAAAWLLSAWPGNVIPVPKTSTLFRGRVHCRN